MPSKVVENMGDMTSEQRAQRLKDSVSELADQYLKVVAKERLVAGTKKLLKEQEDDLSTALKQYAQFKSELQDMTLNGMTTEMVQTITERENQIKSNPTGR